VSYLKTYKILLFDIRLFSKITTFLMIIFALVEIIDFTNTFLRSDIQWDWIYANGWDNLIFIGFVLLLILIFSLRFAFLSSKKLKFVWMAQLLWLIGFLTLFVYPYIIAKLLFGSFFGSRSFNCIDCMYYDTFLGVTPGFFYVLIGYLLLSPVKQGFLLFYSLAPYFKEKSKKSHTK
jgi:hypothetical protein